MFKRGPKLNIKAKVPASLKAAMLLFTLAGAGVVSIVPGTFPVGAEYPDVKVFAVAGIVMVLLTALLFGFVNKLKLGFPKSAVTMAFLFSSIIVAIKCFVSPLSLYNLNQVSDFDVTAGDPNTPFFYLLSAAVVFLLYWIVLRFIYRHFAANPFNHPENLAVTPSAPKTASKSHWRVRGRFTLILVVLALIVFFFMGGGIFFVFFGGFSLISYLSYVFSGAGSQLLILLLMGIVLAFYGFKEADAAAIKLRDATILANFFWVALTLALAYHLIWIVYMVTLVNIWPFRTYTPK